MQQSQSYRPTQCVRAIREQQERDRGWQGEAGPGRQPSQITRTYQTDGKSHLATGRTRQELTERHEIREVRVVEPAAAHDEFLAEVADVSDRSAE